MPDHGAKKKLLQHAVDAERTCAEHLRTWVGHYGLILCCFYCNWRRGWWWTPQQWREEADHGSSPEVPISVVRDCRSQPGPPGAPPENPPVSSQEFLLSQTNSTYLFQSVWPLDWCGRKWRYQERRLISIQQLFYISFVHHATYSKAINFSDIFLSILFRKFLCSSMFQKSK